MKIPGTSVSEIRDFLAKMPLFSGLGDPSLMEIARLGKLVTYNKSQFVFSQSDPSENFYIIRSGDISILLGSADGRELVINEMRMGDFLGELGLLTKQPRSTSAVARIDSELLVFPGHAFLKILDAEPLLVRRILEIIAHRLRSSTERESALAFWDAQARLARILLQLEKQETEKGYVTISQEELAQRTGLTRQTAAKILGRWRRAGWLITGRGHILLLKHAELSKLEKEWLIE